MSHFRNNSLGGKIALRAQGDKKMSLSWNDLKVEKLQPYQFGAGIYSTCMTQESGTLKLKSEDKDTEPT